MQWRGRKKGILHPEDWVNEKETNFSLMCKEQRCYNTGQGSGLVGKCLLHKQKDLSSDPSTHIKSQAQSRVLAVCYWRWARERVSWACQSASLMKLVSSELCKRSCLKEKNEVESSQRRHPMLTSDPHSHTLTHIHAPPHTCIRGY